MYENLLVEIIVAVVVAVIGWYAGTSVEKKRHGHELNLIFLREKVEAYRTLLSDLRKMSVFTGHKIVSGSCSGNGQLCEELRKQLAEWVAKMFEDGSNPFILKDKNVKEGIKKINKLTSKLDLCLVMLANKENIALVDAAHAQDEMMNAIRDLESAVADKYDQILVTTLHS